MSASQPSQFTWYELMTTEPTAALDYYRHVVGWNTEDAGVPGMQYTLLMVGTTSIGGVMELPPQARAGGAQPAWVGYIGVDDVDAGAQRIVEAGGKMLHGPAEIPDIGRFAFITDPQGAPIILFKGKADMPDAQPAMGTPGHVGWHELHAADGASAFDFYSKHFGWKREEAMDMGPMGMYQLFSAGGAPIGGMMTKSGQTPMPMWLFYFNVDDIDAAGKRITERGGQIVNGPMEVPGGSWIINALDPQRAMFAVLGPKKG